MIFLVVGYMVMTRSFAYLGVPPAKIFIGEIALGTFLALRSEVVLSRIRQTLTATSPFDCFIWPMLLLLAYGVFEVVRGERMGRPILRCLENFAFNYYPFFLFLGIWVGSKYRLTAWSVIRKMAWVNGIYGILYIALLSRRIIYMPGSNARVFGQPSGSAFSLLGILCYEENLSALWLPILLNLVVLVGVQVRAEWVGFGGGLGLWLALTGNYKKAMKLFGPILALLIMAYVADLRIRAPVGRGGYVSVRGTIGRVLAPVDKGLAKKYNHKAAEFAGTVSWRQRWWKAIWRSSNSRLSYQLFGHGYGFKIAGLVTYVPQNIRTPHDIFFYCLGYGGWCEVTIFFLFIAGIARGFYKVYRRNGQAYGLVFLVAILLDASFSNFFETPYGAIPFYLISGLLLADLVRTPDPPPASRRSREWAERRSLSLAYEEVM